MQFYAGYGYHASNFEQTYRCYPASFFDKPHLEGGDKVIMPPSALDRLASLHIEYPMLFELHNGVTDRISHCGVLEFVAEEGMIIMPYWMMQNMLLQEGDIVRVKNATLPKGTYVKLQPHTTDFLDISNPKAILEKTLRNFSCLTTGDSIMVAYNNKQYYIDIVEAKPASAVSIIETDCEVDFAPPLDYKEPEKPQRPIVPAGKAPAEDQEVIVEDEPKFKPFTGSGKRLDGKGPKQPAPGASSATAAARSAPSDSNKRANQQTASPSGASTSTRQKTGKLVFGSSASSKKEAEAQKEPAKGSEPPKKEEPKFNAFTGKSYSLKR
uniref:Ubiquitin fusion degradation protein n=1 Tax=Triticum aestivum TaxID=4565 RepID=A0A3B6DHQ0_WHEAT